MNDEVQYVVEDSIATLSFNRPALRNAMSAAMYTRMVELIGQFGQNDAEKVLVLRGVGDLAFISGSDIGQLKSVSNGDAALEYSRTLERTFEALETCPKPVIAAISGACTGGGLVIAACCDLRIASAGTKFGMPIARTLGNYPSAAGLVRLAEVIGPQRVLELVLTARLASAEEMLPAGFLSEVLPTPDALWTRAAGLSRQIAGHAPLSMRAAKEAMRRWRAARRDVPDEDLTRLCFDSADFAEGLDSFLNKRKPTWSGK